MFVIIGDNIFTAYLSGKEKAGKAPLKHRSRAKYSVLRRKKKLNKIQLGAALVGLSKGRVFDPKSSFKLDAEAFLATFKRNVPSNTFNHVIALLFYCVSNPVILLYLWYNLQISCLAKIDNYFPTFIK